MSDEVIEARHVSKTYTMGRVQLEVLKHVSLTIESATRTAIVGPSGAGKSTLLHVLAGLDAPTTGDVFWEGTKVSSLDDDARARFRNQRLGIVFQFYHLLPELTALENVLLPGLMSRHRRGTALRDRAAHCLKQVGLSARARHRPGELSGGEQQRVAIARALVNEPSLLFCDEPTGNLDSKTGEEILDVLLDLNRRHGVGLVLVTHEEQVAGLADRVLTLRDGCIEEGVG